MENNKYTPLPLTFKKNGFTYKQVERTETTAIYEQILEGKTIAYEVYIIRTQEAGEMSLGDRHVILEAKELLPGTEQWGTYGWTCQSLREARRKVSLITQKAIEGKEAPTV